MGTETVSRTTAKYLHQFLVKLNNPLMGTETIYHLAEQYLKYHNQVKLNNPLMGTETLSYRISVTIAYK